MSTESRPRAFAKVRLVAIVQPEEADPGDGRVAVRFECQGERGGPTFYFFPQFLEVVDGK